MPWRLGAEIFVIDQPATGLVNLVIAFPVTMSVVFELLEGDFFRKITSPAMRDGSLGRSISDRGKSTSSSVSALMICMMHFTLKEQYNSRVPVASPQTW